MGRLDILVNNAGIIRRAAAEAYDDADWDAVLEVNLTSVFRLCRAAGQHMLAEGGGKIINVASVLSFQGGVRVPAYAAAKGGVAQLTKTLCNEWAAVASTSTAWPRYFATNNTAQLQADEAEPPDPERIPRPRPARRSGRLGGLPGEPGGGLHARRHRPRGRRLAVADARPQTRRAHGS
jgi:2-deoxy-D-gluconate 3-dehydrogenase